MQSESNGVWEWERMYIMKRPVSRKRKWHKIRFWWCCERRQTCFTRSDHWQHSQFLLCTYYSFCSFLLTIFLFILSFHYYRLSTCRGIADNFDFSISHFIFFILFLFFSFQLKSTGFNVIAVVVVDAITAPAAIAATAFAVCKIIMLCVCVCNIYLLCIIII